MIFWWLLWIVLSHLVIALIRRRLRSGGLPPADRQDQAALNDLKQRSARGEIDREEFEAMMRDLGY